MKHLTFVLLGIAAILYGCSDSPSFTTEHTPTLPEVNYEYSDFNEDLANFEMPATINVLNGNDILVNGPGNSQVFFNVGENHDAKATLGRVLFYDNRMSRNNSIACASCHQQKLAFADDAALSQGFGGENTIRNSMSLANPALNETFFWDGRSRSLESLALQPVFNHIEMGMENTQQLVSKISEEAYYPELFQDAYGSAAITSEGIQDALAAFIMSITSADSKFDEGLESDFSSYSELEKHGMALFFSDRAQCSSCHNGRNFASPTGFTNDNPYRETAGATNIGLDVVYDDPGFASGKFKIPSLRNIAQTAPYMHDGRFETLMQVVEHYDKGVQPHTDLDVKLSTNGNPQQLGLTELDKDALVAFMRTLSSENVLTNERYSNPF